MKSIITQTIGQDVKYVQVLALRIVSFISAKIFFVLLYHDVLL